MTVEDRSILKAKKASSSKDGVDPEALTHYLGNDEYRNGSSVEDLDESEEKEADGHSAEGNENFRHIDENSDLSEVSERE